MKKQITTDIGSETQVHANYGIDKISIDKAIASLINAKEDGATHLMFDMDKEYDTVSIQPVCVRDETDREEMIREQNENNAKEEAKQKKEEQNRALYLELKSKYEK